MHKIQVHMEDDGYDIVVGNGILSRLSELILPVHKPSKLLIVTNPSIDTLHGETLRTSLEPIECETFTEVIPEGEEWKNLQTVEKLLDRMVEVRLDRKSMVIVLGGGVVGDTAGFAASIFMRGIGCVQVPTTLLAQVDSSVGGKVGVDHPLGKNLIGAFHQPRLVCVDPALLSTLPRPELRNGMAEIIKYGVIADEGLFRLLERNSTSLTSLEEDLLEDIIRRCCQIKARIVQQDVREVSGLRVILNYGHTLGHAIESVTGYTRFTHGEAVSIGMVAAAKIARLMGLASEDVEERQQELLMAAGLPTSLDGMEAKRLVDACRLDKKAAAGRITFVLPIATGKAVTRDNVPADVIERALREIGAS